MIAADAVAVLHGAAVLFMLTGALLALRWPRLLIAHLPVALGILVINRAGADCPLTTLELWLRVQAGEEPYRGGFLLHYVFAPLGIDKGGASAEAGRYLVAVLLNVVGYALLAVRLLHGPAGTAPAAGGCREAYGHRLLRERASHAGP